MKRFDQSTPMGLGARFARWAIAGLLWAGASLGVSAQTLTGLSFSSPFVNVGGGPANIFVTAVPAGASLANCTVTGANPLLATYDPQAFFGPTITISSNANSITQAVAHALTCGTVSQGFVVKPPTYPASIVLSAAEIKADATSTSITVTPSPSGTTLPACTVAGTTATAPVLATVVQDAAGTRLSLNAAGRAITADATQVVTCGSLSGRFVVKPGATLTGIALSANYITNSDPVASIAVTPIPASAAMPTCTVASASVGGAVLSTVATSATGTKITFNAAGLATTVEVAQTVTCGAFSQSFAVGVGPALRVDVAGPITSQTLTAFAKVASEHQGKPGAVYVALIYGGSAFFLDSTGAFQLFRGTGSAPHVYAGNLTEHSKVIASSLDLSVLRGLQVIVGYGLGVPVVTDPFNDMLANVRYRLAHTVN